MKRTILATIGALALLLFIGAPASAQDDEDYDDAYSYPGAYLGVDAIAAVKAFDAQGGESVEEDNAVSGGVSARLGYRFHRSMAVEAQFIWVDEWNFQRHGHTTTKLQDATSGLLNFKYFFMTSRFQPYGIIGAGITRMRFKTVKTGNKQKSTEPSMQVGGGLDFYLTDGFGLNTEVVYHRQFDDLDDYSMVNLNFGVFLRF